MTNVPSGWYPNPHNPGEEMYWDGTSWSGAARKLSASRVEEATMVRADATAAAQQAGASELARQPARGPAVVDTVVEDTLDPVVDALEFGAAGWPVPVDDQLAAQHPIPFHDQQWHSEAEPRKVSSSNWFGAVALILGCCGALLTLVPLFIGLIAGGILNLCAIGFCVFGVLRGRQLDGTGVVLSLIGGALGALGLVAMTVGAGTTW